VKLKKEIEKYRNYSLISFKEDSIITIRYNPQEDTLEYWCDNNKVNFIREIYDIRFYFSKFFIKINNFSIKFLCILNAPKSENLNKRIPLKIFPIKDETVKLDINNYNNLLEFKVIDNSFVSLQNDPKFE
jgi:hypothetical protein